jgi:hypothetical protein
MEILGLHVEREHVGEQSVERARDVAGRIGAKIARRIELRLAGVP